MAHERIPMTREGYEKLKAERERLQAEIVAAAKRVAAARELGDLRENAEYHGARETHGMLQARFDALCDKLSRAHIIEPSTVASDTVVFGVRVRVKDLDVDEDEVY